MFILGKKMTTRQAKQHLNKMLGKFSNGLPPSTRYQVLKEAKTFAEDNNIPYPESSQQDLTQAAKEHLGNYLALT